MVRLPGIINEFKQMGYSGKVRIRRFDTYKKAIELNGNDASVFNNLGVLYFRKKMHADARRCFEKVLAIDANYAEAQQNLEKIFSLKNS